MPNPPLSSRSASDRAALAYEAGQDLWRAVDAINEARAKLRDSGHGAIRLQAMKVQDMVEGLAHKAELAADAVMAVVNDD